MKNTWKKWIDVVLFAGTLGLAGYVLLTGAGTGRQSVDRVVRRAEAGVKKVDSALEIDRYPGSAAAQQLNGIDGLAEAARRRWTPKREERRLAQLSVYHPGTIDDVRSGREIELRLFGPTNVTASAEPGVISIHWAANDRTTANVSAYVVYRAAAKPDGGTDGPFTAVKTLGSEQTTFNDTDVRAGQAYAYRVAAKTDDPTLVKAGLAESPQSEPVQQRAARDFEIRLKAADATKKTMRFLVRRLVGDLWYEKEFDGAVGELIGMLDPGSNIDYGTQCRVVDLSSVEETSNEVREEIVFAADGTVVLVNGKPQKRSVTVPSQTRSLVCVITNERGEREEIKLKP